MKAYKKELGAGGSWTHSFRIVCAMLYQLTYGNDCLPIHFLVHLFMCMYMCLVNLPAYSCFSLSLSVCVCVLDLGLGMLPIATDSYGSGPGTSFQPQVLHRLNFRSRQLANKPSYATS